MPVAVSYPGVYVEEIPSGVRTLTGVATSITAFLGTARRGPVDDPITLTSYADFERRLGGLWQPSTLGYSVRDFFSNGGSRAIVVRVVGAGAVAASFDLVESVDPVSATVDGSFQLEAASPGAWGDALAFRVDHVPVEGGGVATAFNLTVRDTATETEERYLNISTAPGSTRTLDRVLASSQLVRLVAGGNVPLGSLPVATPPATFIAPSVDGDDGDEPNTADLEGSRDARTGLYALENADLFNLLCIPPPTRGGETAVALYSTALDYCVERRAFLIVDPPLGFLGPADGAATLGALGLTGVRARNAAVYFPRVLQPDPLAGGFVDEFVPCGIVAGVMARTDAQRGVWKAPAGLDASLNGVQGVTYTLTDAENGLLNPLGINCLRTFPVNGRVIWGARTLRGADQAADEYKYIPVRRLALFMEESLYRGTQWVVFEPNDEPLWAQIRLNLGAFMNNLFRQGAFQGKSPREAYFVKCDAETTTQNDINLGIVNIVVGFAPLKPAEFVIIKVQQMAGQIAT